LQLFILWEAQCGKARCLYTLVSNAKLQGLDPFAYLRDVLEKIADYPFNKILYLLPVDFKNF